MEEIYIFGHKNPDTDTILSALILEAIEKTMGIYKTKAYRLGEVNKETQYALDYFGVKAPELLEEVEEGRQVMLVDHNEFGQSVKGIEKAKIIRVVDHHKIANFETKEPLFYMAMPVGCTATILRDMCKVSGIKLDRITAGLMLSAIISDTLLLKSPTTTEKDKETAKELAKIANVDLNAYGMDMLKAGTDLSDFTPEQLINIDSKPFCTKGVKYQVAQVNTASIDNVMKDKEKIEEAMAKFMHENEEDLFVFLITDIISNNSQVIALGRQDIVERAFDVEIKENTAFLSGVVSRKKQVVPRIDSFIG